MWRSPNKWKIRSQLSAMFTCWDGIGGKLSSQFSKMLYKEQLDQSDCRKLFVQLWNYTKETYGQSLFCSEIFWSIDWVV